MTTPAETSWVVTTPSERITVDDRGHAETTVTVTNVLRSDRDVSVRLVTDESAAAWFTIDDPHRTIQPGATAPFAVTVAVPPATPPGEYVFHAEVSSITEESPSPATLSGRVVLEVPAIAAARPRRRRLWWLAIPAALLLAAATVTAVVVALRPDAEPPAAPATVPDLTGLDGPAARAAVEAAGLTADIDYHHDPAGTGLATSQSVPAGTALVRGATIDVVITVALQPPALVSPASGATLTAADGSGPAGLHVELTWTQPEPYVTGWLVVIRHWICHRDLPGHMIAFPVLVERVETASYSGARYSQQGNPNPVVSCGTESWQVAALDDAGVPGPFSDARDYHFAPLELYPNF